MSNIILIGFKNCGKTTVGKLLAKLLAKKLIDIDELLEKTYAKQYNNYLSTCDIYKKLGKERFRQLETYAINTLTNTKNSIIATGGGSVINENNAKIIKNLGTIAYLDASLETIEQRIFTKPLPAFLDTKSPHATFIKLYNDRKIIYENLADFIIDTENLTPAQIAAKIIDLL